MRVWSVVSASEPTVPRLKSFASRRQLGGQTARRPFRAPKSVVCFQRVIAYGHVYEQGAPNGGRITADYWDR